MMKAVNDRMEVLHYPSVADGTEIQYMEHVEN